MADFMDAINRQLTGSADNLGTTENGALGYKTTGKALLDMNFAVSSMRNEENWPDWKIRRAFSEVCAENLDLAIVWLFFCRDVRGGMGERRVFRVCLDFLASNYPVECDKVLHLVAEYGRWDDLFGLIGSKVNDRVFQIIRDQLIADVKASAEDKPVSLLAKWLPSINSHSKETRKKARKIAEFIGFSRFNYQGMCSMLRKSIHLVESQMSAGQWGEIDYDSVPSKANLIYSNAFLRHDEMRRIGYLSQVERGEAKINSSAVFPYEIVAKYTNGHSLWGGYAGKEDETLEAMWKALPNFVKNGCSTLVVADGSGSMMAGIGNGNVSALDVANSLAIYFAERLNGEFRNTYITFSHSPQIVHLGEGTLLSKLRIAEEHDECSNTDIEKVFKLILRTAVAYKMKQEDLPSNVLIISDMEFDMATEYRTTPSGSLFDEIRKQFEKYGYRLPRLVFWNVSSRSGVIPLVENPAGVALVSGFSPAIAKMVLSASIDPYEALVETLNSPRYNPVRDALSH